MEQLKIIEAQFAEIKKLRVQLKCLLTLLNQLTKDQQQKPDLLRIFLNQKSNEN